MAARQPPAQSSRFSGARLILAGIVLWLGLLLLYCWPAWGMVLYRVIVDGGVALLWLASAMGIGEWLLLLLLGSNSEEGGPLLKLVTATALGLGAMSLLILGLGLTGGLNHAVAIAVVAVGMVLGAAWLLYRRWTPDQLQMWLRAPAGWSWLVLLAVPLIALMSAGQLLPPYLLWTPQEPHGYDVVEYHLQVPREWYEAGRIVPLHHNVYSYFPFNVEMHYLLGMHLHGGPDGPWAAMYLAQIMHGMMILLAALAAGTLITRRSDTAGGKSSSAPAIAVLAMLGTPWLVQLGAIAYDEGGFLLFGVLATGWALRALQEPAQRIRQFVLAGAMAGFACGVKLTAVPEILGAIGVVSLILLIVRERSQPLRQRIAGPVVFVLVGVLFFSPWLLRTWQWSGNPVFPEMLALGHGDFSAEQVRRWERAHAPRPDQRPLLARLHAAGVEILYGWQYGFLLLPMALAALIACRKDPQIWFLGAMLFLLAVFWTGFTHLQGRFFILCAPICALLIARLPYGAGLLVIAQAVLALVLLNWHYLRLLDEKFAGDRQLYASIVGTEKLDWMTASVPKGLLVLVGDGRAFVYQRPMSALRYRTPFDLNITNGQDLIDAWAGPSTPAPQWFLIDPLELKRFAKTYQPFPQLPPSISQRDEPFLLKRQERL